jgi:hypothetical protein
MKLSQETITPPLPHLFRVVGVDRHVVPELLRSFLEAANVVKGQPPLPQVGLHARLLQQQLVKVCDRFFHLVLWAGQRCGSAGGTAGNQARSRCVAAAAGPTSISRADAQMRRCTNAHACNGEGITTAKAGIDCSELIAVILHRPAPPPMSRMSPVKTCHVYTTSIDVLTCRNFSMPALTRLGPPRKLVEAATAPATTRPVTRIVPPTMPSAPRMMLLLLAGTRLRLPCPTRTYANYPVTWMPASESARLLVVSRGRSAPRCDAPRRTFSFAPVAPVQVPSLLASGACRCC